MSEFENITEVLNHRANRVITKRIEPYDVIESAKKFYDVVDYTFTGRNKFEIMEEFLSALSSNKSSIGLYMKNVNKFYLLTIKENPLKLSDVELLHRYLITDEYDFSEDEQVNQIGIKYSTDTEYAIEQIDMGKAEASFILS